MPTGFTAPIEDGTVTDIKDYAAACARAFGVFIHQRDEGFSGVALRYPDAPEKSYYTKALAKAKETLSDWQQSSEEDKYAQWSDYYSDSLVARAKIKARSAVQSGRYQAMLAQVLALDVPSKLQEFKNFMIEQIELSDSGSMILVHSVYTPFEYVEWCESRDKSVLGDVVYYEEQLNKEKSRYIEACEYIDLMIETFGFEVEK